MDQFSQFIPLILLAVVFWLFIIRPMRKRQKESAAIQQAVNVGSDIMLASGIFGTVASIDDEKVAVTVAPGTTITVHRQAIGKVFSEPPAEDSATEDRADGDSATEDRADSETTTTATSSDDK